LGKLLNYTPVNTELIDSTRYIQPTCLTILTTHGLRLISQMQWQIADRLSRSSISGFKRLRSQFPLGKNRNIFSLQILSPGLYCYLSFCCHPPFLTSLLPLSFHIVLVPGTNKLREKLVDDRSFRKADDSCTHSLRIYGVDPLNGQSGYSNFSPVVGSTTL